MPKGTKRAVAELNGSRISAEDRAHTRGAGGRAQHPEIATADGDFEANPPARRRRGAAENGNGATAADHLARLESTAPQSSKQIIIPQLDIQTMRITVVGDSSLITHSFSQKAKTAIRKKQTGEATEGRAFKDPESDFQNSLYRLPNGDYGFPAIAFKDAAVTACTSLGKAVTKMAARQAFHVVGDKVKINGTPTMREDTVRVGMGTTDLRYRGEFIEWSAELTIRYNARVLTAEQIINLFNVAGFAVGVGEWRPERNGQNGLFHVV